MFIFISPGEPERPKTHCEHYRDSVQTTSPEGYPITGAYVPQCDANGQYIPLQVCVLKSLISPPNEERLIMNYNENKCVVIADVVYFSVMAPLDIVGVWTVMDRREWTQEQHLVQHP